MRPWLPTLGAIIGRVDDVVMTPEGVAVGPAALSLAFQGVPNLRESQIVQDSTDRIALALAVTPAYGPQTSSSCSRSCASGSG